MSERGSKYGGLFSRAAEEEEESGGEVAPLRPRRRRNRKKTGKRSNPNYRQVTAYIQDETYEVVKHALIGKKNEQGKKLQFSELVDSLLREWAEEEGWSLENMREAKK